MPEQDNAATVDQLRVVPGFRGDEADRLRDTLRKLDRRLSRFDAGAVDMELSVKERDTPSQRVVLECWIAGHQKMVATSTESRIEKAVVEVREDLWRQIDRAVNKRTGRR